MGEDIGFNESLGDRFGARNDFRWRLYQGWCWVYSTVDVWNRDVARSMKTSLHKTQIILGLWSLCIGRYGRFCCKDRLFSASVSFSARLCSNPLVLNVTMLVSIARSMSAIIDDDSVFPVSSRFSLEENCPSIWDWINRGTSWRINSLMGRLGGGGSSWGGSKTVKLDFVSSNNQSLVDIVEYLLTGRLNSFTGE